MCVFASFPVGFEDGVWDLIVLVPVLDPENCLSLDCFSSCIRS